MPTPIPMRIGVVAIVLISTGYAGSAVQLPRPRMAPSSAPTL
ncbi:MAG TPA: hypothetical protein VN700_15365 [Vicinamibacterales bacterium]|nr:hypothetical protein [Vicinamibacterales bacterium]